MAGAKKIRIPYQTSVGRIDYSHVVVPDTKFGAPVYHVTFSLDPTEGKAMLAELEAKHPSFKGLIPYQVKDDGRYSFKVKQRKYIQWFDKGVKQEKELLPTLLNKDNTPYEGAEPWGGSTGEVAMYLEPTKGPQGESVALRLKGVRFHDVVLGSGGGAADPMFGPAPVSGAAASEEETDFDDDIPFSN